MPKEIYPFYFDAKDKNLLAVTIECTPEEQIQREQDMQIYRALDDYQAPFRDRWRMNGALYNLIQNGTNDSVINWYLGWARIIIGYSVATMTEGQPEFDFEPVGPSDQKTSVLWNALVKHILSKSNWQAHQKLWVIDNHVYGNGALKAYSELPMRRRWFTNGKGEATSRFVRDFRRAKVGLRHRSPFRCMRSHFVSDPDEVPVGIERDILTHNAFAVRFGNAILPDGTKKYDTEGIPLGSHYQVTTLYFEEEDAMRCYVMPFGGKPEDTYQEPPEGQLGKCIYNKPLSRYKFIDGGRSLAGGANVAGMTPLAFSTFEDQLDDDYETHSVYGMGIPQIIEGPESLMQSLVNQTNLNLTLKNTVPISWEPNNSESPSAAPVDVSEMYSGLMLDGKVLPQPLGVADMGSNQVMWEWLNELSVYLTGINFKQLAGDDLKTAFQAGLRNRQNNQRALSRIRGWEQGPLKRAGILLLSNALSDLTVKEYEEITEDQAKELADKIGQDQMTGEDMTKDQTMNADGTTSTTYNKRIHFWFPVEGRKYREDFTGKNKTRTLDGSVDGTLIEDKDMPGTTSWVPADEKYLFPTGTIESVLQFDCNVDGKHMLGDLKMQDSEMATKAITNAITIAQADPDGVGREIDWKKLLIAANRPAGFEESDFLKDGEKGSQVLESVRQLLGDMLNASIPPNQNGQVQATGQPGAVPAPAAPAVAGQPPNPGSQLSGPAKLIDRNANGLV